MNDSVRLFEAEMGLEGFAVLIKIWQSIYSGEGYFKLFDKDVCLLFATEIGVRADFVADIINKALERDIFSRELFENYKILTSAGVQRRFFKCGERRKEIPVLKEYLLISPDDFSNLSVCKLNENVNISKQSKVKKSKVKKSKVKESKETAPATDSEELILGEYKNVHLTRERYSRLMSNLGERRLLDYIKKVDEYVQLSGKEYKDFYLVIKRWAREDGEKTSPKKSRFVNYQDTNTHDYTDFQKKILEEMLDE